MHALGFEFGSAAQLSKRPGSVWNCLWGNALKRSPGIIRKSRVSYPGPGFLSSATWPSLPKKHYNGLNQIKPIKIHSMHCFADRPSPNIRGGPPARVKKPEPSRPARGSHAPSSNRPSNDARNRRAAPSGNDHRGRPGQDKGGKKKVSTMD